MSNDPRTLGRSLVFQHDLVIICGACKSANACINYYGKILKKKKKKKLWKSQPISDGR